MKKKILALTMAIVMGLGLLAGCANTSSNEPKTVTFEDTIEWHGNYDVVVIGFGGAGAVAAKSAADEDVSVLIVEKAPEGHEGGNMRYSGQTFTYGNKDYESTLTYFKAMFADHDIPDAVLEMFCKNVANLSEIVANEYDLDINEITDARTFGNQGSTGCEYPELPGSEVITLMATHSAGNNDGYFWSLMRDRVASSENIDVWFESPATHLIQDPVNKTVIGVQVERNGETLNIRANNGVVMACGGFSANQELVESYLGITDSVPVGSVYNTGDGIAMASEVGAQMWHMESYLGMGNALGAASLIEERVLHYVSYMPPCINGSVVLVTGNGERFINERGELRHGLVDSGDVWKNPDYPENMYLIMSAVNYQTALAYKAIPEDYAYTYSGNTLAELAEAAGMNAETLAATVANYNGYAKTGVDLEFGRAAETMEAFPEEGPYYAVKLGPTVLITRGGAKRNENAEVLDVNDNPIPHLYSAGEFGSIVSLQYQPGACIAECVIFGLTAGENAAKAKEYTSSVLTEVESNPIYVLGYENDMKKGDYSHIELGENEHLGVGTGGMGGDIAVKVKIVEGKIEAIEIAEDNETPDRLAKVVETLIPAIIENQSTEVDVVSSCTLSSNAVIEAVNNAIADSQK